MALRILLNGNEEVLPALSGGTELTRVIDALGLSPERVAVEQNGAIVRRAAWPTTRIVDGDKLEVVHFVGGGSEATFRQKIRL